MRSTTEGNIKLELKNGNIVLLSERNNKTLDEITLEDDTYRKPYDLSVELLGYVMKLVVETNDLDTLKEAIQDELDNNL